MRDIFIEELVKEAESNKNIVLVSGDLGYGCLEKFSSRFPDRFFNLGIAEQNMLGVCAGLAMEGKKVFVYSIGNFNTLRCIEQIRNDVCYMNLDVNILSVGAGLEYGQLGFSHHATEDLSVMRAMPNMMVFSPSTDIEAKLVLKEMVKSSSPCYVRLNKKGVLIDKKPRSLAPYLVKDGERVAIFATGSILEEAIKASDMLERHGLRVAVYSFAKVKPLKLSPELLGYDNIFTLEEQTIVGGFGSAVLEQLANLGGAPKVRLLGIEDKFSSLVGDRQYLREYFQIDAKSIAKTILKNLKK